MLHPQVVPTDKYKNNILSHQMSFTLHPPHAVWYGQRELNVKTLRSLFFDALCFDTRGKKLKHQFKYILHFLE